MVINMDVVVIGYRPQVTRNRREAIQSQEYFNTWTSTPKYMSIVLVLVVIAQNSSRPRYIGETGVNWDKKHIFADCMVGVQIDWVNDSA